MDNDDSMPRREIGGVLLLVDERHGIIVTLKVAAWALVGGRRRRGSLYREVPSRGCW